MIHTQQLTFAYTEETDPVLKNITFSPDQASFHLIMGPSGGGKSTLLKCLAGLYPQYGGHFRQGQVLWNQTVLAKLPPYQRAQHVALLFQHPNRQFAMATPYEQLVFSLENLQVSASKIPDRVTQALKLVGMEAQQHQLVQTLSGGEQQRVALASVIAMGSQVILLDEPFANVDPQGRQQLLQVLNDLHQQGRTVIVTDHDAVGYEQVATTVWKMDPATQQLKPAQLTEFMQAEPSPKVIIGDKKSALLQVKGLSLKLATRRLLESTDFQVPQGQLGLLSGANGVGKSTLFAALSGQKAPATGEMIWEGQPVVKQLKKHWPAICGVVFQQATDQFIRLTVKEELTLSHQRSHRSDYWTTARIEKASERLGLSGLQDRVVYQLSGGQQKRVQVLAMLIMAPPILLLDEPLAGLDFDSLQYTMQLIKHCVRELQLTALMISHQRQGVVSEVDYEWVIANQKLNQGGVVS